MPDTIISTEVIRRGYGYFFQEANDQLTILATGSLTSLKNIAVYSG